MLFLDEGLSSPTKKFYGNATLKRLFENAKVDGPGRSTAPTAKCTLKHVKKSHAWILEEVAGEHQDVVSQLKYLITKIIR